MSRAENIAGAIPSIPLRKQPEGPWVRTAKSLQSYVLDPVTAVRASGFVPIKRGTAVPERLFPPPTPPSRWRPSGK